MSIQNLETNIETNIEKDLTPNQEEVQPAAGKKKKAILITALIIFCVLGIGLGCYLYYGYQHKDEFFKGTFINDVDVSGMTVEQVEDVLAESASAYAITVTTKEDETATITAADIDYQYQINDAVKKMHDTQVWWKWGFAYLASGKDKSGNTVPIVYDKEKLESVADGWSFMNKTNQIAPVDAELVYENGQYVVTEHVDGNTIDKDVFLDALTAAVDNGAAELTVEEAEAYVLPKVTSDDPVLNDNAKTLNEEANFNISYSMPDGSTKAIDKDVLLTWMSMDEAGRYYRDEEVIQKKVKEFVTELNTAVEACNESDVTFTSGNPNNQREVTVPCYISGTWALDVEAETAKLTEEVASRTTTTREPVYSARRFEGDGLLGDTYVEIDLSAQHLWYYEDGEVKLDSDIVSGTYTNPSRRTPGGIYDLDYKQEDRTLRGQKKQVVTEVQVPVEVVVPGTDPVLDEQGNVIQEGTPPTTVIEMKTEQKIEEKYEYESFVDYWMPFNGGIGMHDASWRGSFGGSIYKYSGSHGCINMPASKAKALYGMIETNCVVVCYY